MRGRQLRRLLRDGGGSAPVYWTSLVGGVSVCVSGSRTGVHTSCVVGTLAILLGTSRYFRGTTLPGWILNGGLLVPVDALGLEVVRGGRLVVSRKRLRGACATPDADRCLMGPCRCSVSLLFLFLFGLVRGAFLFSGFCWSLPLLSSALSGGFSSWFLLSPPSACCACGRAGDGVAAAAPPDGPR